jgi:hypothetical protein
MRQHDPSRFIRQLSQDEIDRMTQSLIEEWRMYGGGDEGQA